MALRFLKWILLALLLLILVCVLTLAIGSRLALDHDYKHSRETAALPLYSGTQSSGLVRVQANDMEFRVRLAGCARDASGIKRPAVILLHGFPATSAMWLPLVDPLVAAGFCVVAPDQRGYSPGARPDGVEHYVVELLSEDVRALADALALERFHLVGHDWGSVVGWTTVMRAPERVISWSALSIAHPLAFARALQEDPEQRARSRYFILFSTPFLAEALFTFNDLALLSAGYGDATEEQRAEYLKLFAEPGAMTGALNWYRAMGRSLSGADETGARISAPTLFIWGNTDPAVGRRSVEMQREYLVGRYTEVELDAGHWLLREQPERVIGLVTNHLAAHSLH